MFDGASILVENEDKSLALFHSDSYRFLKAFFILVGNLELVNDHLDIVILVTVHFHTTGNLNEFTIDTHVKVTLTAHGFEKFAIMSFSAFYEGSQYEDAFAGIVVKNHINDFLLCIFHHFLTSGITVSTTCPSKEKTQVVIDLSGSAYG